MHFNDNSHDENTNNHFFNPITGQPINENTDLHKEFDKLLYPDNDEIKYKMLYKETDDLNEKEIDFFVLWNNFMDSYNTKKKMLHSLEEYLIEFIDQSLDYIRTNELINELLLFMTFLLDKGDISFTFYLTWSTKINS